MVQNSAEIRDDGDAAEEESSPKNSLGNSSADANDIEDRTSDFRQPCCEPATTDCAVKDDVAAEADDDDDVKTDCSAVVLAASTNSPVTDEVSDELCNSVADKEAVASTSNLDEPAAATAGAAAAADDYADEEEESGSRLSQREDSGILNVDAQTVGSSGGDQAASSSSSSGDGEVAVTVEAEVIVHASQDDRLTPTDAGPAATDSHDTSNGRRRASADSTRRSVLEDIVNIVEFNVPLDTVEVISETGGGFAPLIQ